MRISDWSSDVCSSDLEVATREALARQISELRSQDQRKYASKNGMSDSSATGNDAVADWQDTLLSVLRRMDPAAFERLAQRFLRVSGFVQEEVTGRSGDEGIDGKGGRKRIVAGQSVSVREDLGGGIVVYKKIT